jgi:flagellar protein FlaG
MALDVSSIQTTSTRQQERRIVPPTSEGEKAARQKAEEPVDLKTTIRDIQRVSEVFNRRLSFSINEKIGQVVVKVIDDDTDKVVSEIPPEDLQRVYERIREVVGLLFDKSA